MGRILSKHTDIRKEQKPVTPLQENSPTPLKSICQHIRSHFEVKTSFVVRQSLLGNERFIKDQMNNGTETPITKCSHAEAIGNKPIFFMPAKKKRTGWVHFKKNNIIINQETNRK